MKVLRCLILLILITTLFGCSATEEVVKTGDPPPTIIIEGNLYIAENRPATILPDGYEYYGILSDEAANDTGLAGCEIYALLNDLSKDFYVYQELAPHFDEATGTVIQSKWAYVQWINVS